MAVWKWQYLDIEDGVFQKFGKDPQKNLNIDIYFKYMNRINRTSSIYFKCQIDRALNIFYYMAVWKWQYLDTEDGVFHKFGKDPQKNLNIDIYFKYMKRINRTSSIDFKCQIDRALNIFYYMAVWKWQYLDTEDGVFHKFGKDPQKNLKIKIYFKYMNRINRTSSIDFRCQIDRAL